MWVWLGGTFRCLSDWFLLQVLSVVVLELAHCWVLRRHLLLQMFFLVHSWPGRPNASIPVDRELCGGGGWLGCGCVLSVA